MNLEEQIKAILGDSADQETLKKISETASSAFEEETKGLKMNQQKLLDQMAGLKKNQVPEGFDKDGYDKYLKDKEEFDKKQKELEEKKLADEGQWEALKGQLLENHQKTISELTQGKDSEISQLRSALDNELIENAAIKAIEKEKGNSFFLLPHMKDSIKTSLQDGKYVVDVVDREGNVRVNDEGKPFTVSDLVAEMKSNEQFAPAFPTVNSGSGNPANSGSSGGNVVNPWKPETKNITQQAKMMKENPTLAIQMKKAAGVG